MHWERLFEDLEQQLAVEEQRDRLAEVPELIRADWARSTLRSRVRALRGRRVRLVCLGIDVEGVLGRISREWLSVDMGVDVMLARWEAIEVFHDLPARHDDLEDTVLDRLGLGHALRGLAQQRSRVAVMTMRATQYEGRIAAVGADYVDVLEPSGRRAVVPFGQVAMVRSAQA